MSLSVITLFAYVVLAGAEASYAVVYDFEAEAELNAWESDMGLELAPEHATSGANSMKVRSGDYLVNWGKRDWSRYDLFEFDVFNDTGNPAVLKLTIGDGKMKKVGEETVWNAFSRPFDLEPEHNTLSLPVVALSRGGEEGSIDPATIVKVEIGVTGREGSFYLDNFRLLRATPPPGVVAVDFGPRMQALAPGFFPVDPETPYHEGSTVGWTSPVTGGAGEAGYPGRLFGDFVRADGVEIAVSLAEGTYKVRLYFNDIGSAPGEQALYAERSVEAEGEVIYLDRRGTRETLDYLRRFERIEASPDMDVWETFVDSTFPAIELEIEVKDGALNLVCRSDSATGAQLAALLAYPVEKTGEAEAWFASTRAWARSRFMGELRYVPGKRRGKIEDVPQELRALGYLLFTRPLDETVGINDVPSPDELVVDLAGVACRGEMVALPFSVLALEDKGHLRVDVGALTSWKGRLGAESVSVLVGVNRFAREEGGYGIHTRDLRRIEAVELKAGTVRSFFLVFAVPEDASAGCYHGSVRLWSEGGIDDEIPILLTVHGFRLERPEFAMGLEGVVSPVPEEEAQRQAFACLRDCGINSFLGAPEVRVRGFDVGGKVLLDYAKTDSFFALAREEGFVSRAEGVPLHGLHAKRLPVIELSQPPAPEAEEAVPPEAPAVEEAAPVVEEGEAIELPPVEAPAVEDGEALEAPPVETVPAEEGEVFEVPPAPPAAPEEEALPPVAPAPEEGAAEELPDGGEPEEGAPREKVVGEKETSFEELVTPVFSDVLAHASSANWQHFSVMIQPPGTPHINHAATLERAKLISSKAPEARLCAWVENLEFKPDPTMEQMIHDSVSVVLAEHMDEQAAGIAGNAGKDLYLYGRGLTRHSFGLTSWKAMEEGLKGHIEPAYFKVCGFQYFDLDGQSPDARAVGYGQYELTPTIDLLRIRAGTSDLAYCAMLRGLIKRGKESRRARKTARKAELFLDSVTDKLSLRLDGCPAWLSPDEIKARAGDYIDGLKTSLGDYKREEKERLSKERQAEREKKKAAPGEKEADKQEG